MKKIHTRHFSKNAAKLHIFIHLASESEWKKNAIIEAQGLDCTSK